MKLNSSNKTFLANDLPCFLLIGCNSFTYQLQFAWSQCARKYNKLIGKCLGISQKTNFGAPDEDLQKPRKRIREGCSIQFYNVNYLNVAQMTLEQ